MLLAEFKANLDQYQSAVNRNLIFYLLPAVILSSLLLIPSWGLLYKIGSLSYSDTELILRAASGIAGMVAFVALMIAFILKTGRLRKRHGLLCPECGKPLMDFIVIASGRCCSCGAVIIPEITCQHKEP